jgi:hypothetical protein
LIQINVLGSQGHSLFGTLTLEDCLGLCDLTEREVLAIAHREHIPEMAALGLRHYLVRAPDGEMRIKSIIRDDIAEARLRGDRAGEPALNQHESAELRTLSAHYRLRTARVQWNEAGKKRYSLKLDIRWPRHQTLVSGARWRAPSSS